MASVEASAYERFDLARPPLVRAMLFRIEDSSYLLALVIHHIVADGWSMGILWRDLAAFYASAEAALPTLQMQYVDYALWQQSMLGGEREQRELAYWRKQLAGLTPLQLPTDRPRPPTPSHRGALHAIEISPPLTSALKQLGRQERVTLYMLLLAAFQVLLGRYSGQDDVAVGSAITGRTRREFKDLIGCFVNTLVLRSDLSGNPPFRRLLHRVEKTALEAYAHQELPFEKLVEDLNPPRDTSRIPLTQVIFTLQNYHERPPTLPGVEATEQTIRIPSAKFDLTLSLVESAGALRGHFEYATDLFDATTLERMAAHFIVLLEGIVAEPDAPIGLLPLLTAEERRRFDTESSETATSDSRNACVPQLVEQQAARAPDATAISYEASSLTYGELNAAANRLAQYLRSLGVGPDVLVGILLERSLDLVVAMLAVLKAGGAYVPLDPGYPLERLAFVLEDTRTPIVLTQASLCDRVVCEHGRLVCVDRDAALWSKMPACDPERPVRPEHLAYVIHTSGSTGKPKGVRVSHANLAHLFSATHEPFRFDSNDAWTCFHSCAFDFSVWEIWGALVHGARLVIVPHRASRNPDAFHALLRNERVTVLNQTPSAFRQLIAADARAGEARHSLRLVILGGEALDYAMLERWFARYGDRAPELVNMYGITETTVHVTLRAIRKADARAASRCLIGGPIRDMRIHLLDRHLQPVPVGVAGEIVVAGMGVAHGYLNRPELTAERFIRDPFSKAASATAYRSGDLARRCSDGELEYLGRSDQQVKLRGFRIELGEIESALKEIPGVVDAAAMLREDIPGDPRLVAYTALPEPRDGAGLLGALKQKLPDYMIPSAFVHLPALPLTANGKIDRRALPPPRAKSEPDESRPPRDAIERIVTDVWLELLKIPRIGANDNFFDIGGHSLLAAWVVARLREAFDIEISIRTLFDAPTVRALADEIAAALRRTGSDRIRRNAW